MKKNTYLIAFVLSGLVLISACGSERKSLLITEGELKTESTKSSSNTVTTGLDETKPKEVIGDSEALVLSKSKWVAMRLPLPNGIIPERLENTVLRLHLKGNGETKEVSFTAFEAPWDYHTLNWENAQSKLSKDSEVKTVSDAGEGWIEIDITEFVRKRLSAEKANNGFLIRTSGDEEVRFDSGWGLDSSVFPYTESRYYQSEDEKGYAKFDYTSQNDGNSLSYALRDLDSIGFNDVVSDIQAFQTVYDKKDLKGALNEFKQLFTNYVEEHREALDILEIRELKKYNSPIDADKEYRIALRVGARDREEPEVIQVENDFGVIVLMQTRSGQWAEKSAGICEGSSGEVDPGIQPWGDSNYWGYDDTNDFYTSNTIYFAVTKDSDVFTTHKMQGE
jgi:hypothetical protein